MSASFTHSPSVAVLGGGPGGYEAALAAAIEQTRDARLLMFSDDEHDPEGSTASLDQVRYSALLARVQRTVAELDAARARLVTGTYGTCERCGQPIAAA